MKSSFRLVTLFTLALVMLFPSSKMTAGEDGTAPTIRWDTISLTFPNGVGTVDAGGSDYALAADLTTIQISGSGTFGRSESAATGGGTWATAGPSGTASGTFTVTRLVRFDTAPGSQILPAGTKCTVVDENMHCAHSSEINP